MSHDTPVSFRLSDELKRLVEEQAEEDGVTFSAKVREYCREGVELTDGTTQQVLSVADYRSKALEAYGAVCNDCGDTDTLEVHHKDRDRSNNSLSNLEVLCRACHVERHRTLDDPRNVNFTLPGPVNDAVEERLDYGDSKAAYVRQAIREKLERTAQN